MKNLFAMTLAAAVAVGGITTLNAHPAHGPKGGPDARQKLRERARERLQLTDEQAAQIKEQVQRQRQQMAALMERSRNARKALHEAIQNPDATEASVREAAAKLATVETDLAVVRFKLRGKVNSVLNDQQREKLADMRSKAGRHLKQRRERIRERRHAE